MFLIELELLYAVGQFGDIVAIRVVFQPAQVTWDLDVTLHQQHHVIAPPIAPKTIRSRARYSGILPRTQACNLEFADVGVIVPLDDESSRWRLAGVNPKRETGSRTYRLQSRL